jgi:hypothetical protein
MAQMSYVLRGWGRPVGLLVGCLTLSLFMGPLLAILGRRGSFLFDDIGASIINAAYSYFVDNLFMLLASLTLIWWWLTFAKYRSCIAFALAGIANCGYPFFLLFGRYLAFTDEVTLSDWAFGSGLIAAFSVAGAVPMLLLHLSAYRRAPTTSANVDTL